MTVSVHEDRMRRFLEAGLYLVTSESMSNGRSTLQVIEQAVAGGVRLVQLREKSLPDAKLLALAEEARAVTAKAGALLLINDRLDIAEKCGADGVHLGLDDMEIDAARAVAPDMIIGASSHNIAEALDAQAKGASYLNIGPIFQTGTKDWQDEFLGIEAIGRIAPHLTVPWTVMGGIKKHHIPDLAAAGALTVAVVTAVTMADDMTGEAAELVALIKKHRRG